MCPFVFLPAFNEPGITKNLHVIGKAGDVPYLRIKSIFADVITILLISRSVNMKFPFLKLLSVYFIAYSDNETSGTYSSVFISRIGIFPVT